MIKVEESLLSNQGIKVYSTDGEADNYEWAECKIYEDDKLIFDVSHSY